MRICRRCGVYAPPEGPSCEACGADLGLQARDALADRLMCAAIRLEVRCDQCHELTPVDRFDPAGTVRCHHCGNDGPFPEKWWRKIFDRAHAVADLYGESAEGRSASVIAIDKVNPFAATARQRSGVVFGTQEADAWSGWLPDPIRAWIGPGIPIGPASGEPFQIRVESAGVLHTRTTRGESARYALDPRAPKMHKGLVGAIGEDHRLDHTHPELMVSRGGTPVCPACGTEVPIDRELKRVRCPSCGTVVQVSSGDRHAANPGASAETWWLVFDGPSPYRRFLERDPSTWDDRHPDERPLERPPVATPNKSDRALTAAWVVLAPTSVLLLVGTMSRLPSVLAWLGRVIGG